MQHDSDLHARRNPLFVDRETVVDLLGPGLIQALATCYRVAWEKYNNLARPLAVLAGPISIATWFREMVLHEVRETVVRRRGVTARDKHGRFLLEINQQVLLQFKKLGPDFSTSNIETATSRAFDRQLVLPGITLPRVTVGYQLNELWTEIEGIWLVFNIGKDNIWAHNLETGVEETPPPLPFPTPEEGAAEREAREQQRRRDDRKDESGAP